MKSVAGLAALLIAVAGIVATGQQRSEQPSVTYVDAERVADALATSAVLANEISYYLVKVIRP